METIVVIGELDSKVLELRQEFDVVFKESVHCLFLTFSARISEKTTQDVQN